MSFFRFEFDYNKELIRLIKTLPVYSRRWNPPPLRYWEIAAEEIFHLAELIKPLLPEIADQLLNNLAYQPYREIADNKKQEIANSRATTAEIDIPKPEGEEYMPFQKAGIKYALDREATLIGDEMGCITGSAVIAMHRAGKGFHTTLEKAYKRFHGMDRSIYNWDKSLNTYARSLMPSGEIRLNQVLDIIYRGRKRIIALFFKNGMLACTPDHKIATGSGQNVEWVRADRLTAQHVVLINGTPTCKSESCVTPSVTYKYAKFKGYCKRCIYQRFRLQPKKGKRFIDRDGYYRVSAPDHPRASRSGHTYEHILVMEKKLGRYLNWPMEKVHHINKIKSDNRPENLEIVDTSAHHRIHKIHLNFGDIFLPKTDKLIRTFDLEETFDVYDIVMAEPAHNFTANGVIVHNCGKTIEALGVANATKPNSILVICPASIKLNWRDEAQKWLIHPYRITVIDKTLYAVPCRNNHMEIINYEQLGNNERWLKKQKYDLVIIDECHKLKKGIIPLKKIRHDRWKE